MKIKILKLIVKYIDLKGLVLDLMDNVVEEILLKAVKESKTKIDDSFVPLVYPMVEKEILKIIEEKLDLNKIFKLEE